MKLNQNHAALSEYSGFKTTILSEIVTSKYSSRAVMCKSRSLEGLTVETAAGNGVCTVFPFKFQHVFCRYMFILEILRNIQAHYMMGLMQCLLTLNSLT